MSAYLTPEQVEYYTPERIALFWSKVDKTETCWLWTAALDSQGYGRAPFRRSARLAHRTAYELTVGPIPADRPQLDHLCRVRNCVRPDHLEPVTNLENSQRGKGSIEFCKRGHPLSGDNLRIYTRACGRRQRKCVTCRDMHNANRYRKEVAA